MVIAAGGVALPDLDQGVGHRLAVLVEHTALHDAEEAVVPDGLLEIWQANSHGRYNHPDDRRNLPLDPGFDGFGRASTDTGGSSRFSTGSSPLAGSPSK